MDTVRDVSVDFQMQQSDFDRTKMQNVPTDMSTSDLPSFIPDSVQHLSQSSPLYHIMVGWIVDEKWPKLVAKNACAWFFARLVESFSLCISSCALFSHRRDALHQAFSYAIEVFDAGESNGRCTKMWFQREHVETASETPRYLSFFVDLTPLRPELAFGAPTIQKSMLFWISLVLEVLSCDGCGDGNLPRDVEKFLSVVRTIHVPCSIFRIFNRSDKYL